MNPKPIHRPARPADAGRSTVLLRLLITCGALLLSADGRAEDPPVLTPYTASKPGDTVDYNLKDPKQTPPGGMLDMELRSRRRGGAVFYHHQSSGTLETARLLTFIKFKPKGGPKFHYIFPGDESEFTLAAGDSIRIEGYSWNRPTIVAFQKIDPGIYEMEPFKLRLGSAGRLLKSSYFEVIDIPEIRGIKVAVTLDNKRIITVPPHLPKGQYALILVTKTYEQVIYDFAIGQ